MGSAALAVSSGTFYCFWVLLRWLVDDAHHGLLERLPFEEEAVLVPDEVGRAQLEVVALHAALEQRQDVAIVGVGREGQAAAVVHELLEFGRLVQAEFVDGHLLLLALDVIIFFVFRASWQALPRQRSPEEVEKHVANGLQVISAALLVPDMRANRGVSRRARQVLALAEGNVLALAIFVTLCQSEVDNVDVVLSALISADEEVVRFDISVDDPFLVHFLNSMDLQEHQAKAQHSARKDS